MLRFFILSLAAFFLGTYRESKAASHDEKDPQSAKMLPQRYDEMQRQRLEKARCLAQEYFPKIMQSTEWERLAGALTVNPEERWEHVLICAKGLVNDTEKLGEWAEVFRALGQIPDEKDRAIVAKLAQSRLTGDLSKLYSEDVLPLPKEAIGSILWDIYTKKIPLAKQVMFHANEEQMSYIIKSIGKIPEKEIQDILKQVLPLFTERMDDAYRVQMIKDLYNIPTEKRAGVIEIIVKYSAALFSSKGIPFKLEILHTIYEIPERYREPILQRSAARITPTMGPDKRCLIFSEEKTCLAISEEKVGPHAALLWTTRR